MKPAVFAAALVLAVAFHYEARAASECGFSGRDANYVDDRAEDRALLNALAEAVREAGHACPKALAAARCKLSDGIGFDVFCQGGDFAIRTKTSAPPFDGATVRPAK